MQANPNNRSAQPVPGLHDCDDREDEESLHKPHLSLDLPSQEPKSQVRATAGYREFEPIGPFHSPLSVASWKVPRVFASAGNSFELQSKFLRLVPPAPSQVSMNSSPVPVAPRDVRLFDAIQNGSSEWKRELFDEYLGLVRGLLIKSMGPQSDVDDLVAEVFVGLFESAQNIRSAGGLRSYIVSVTMNTARREFRRRKRFNLFFIRDEGQEIAERTPGVDDPKAKAALLQLHRILEGLEVEERLIFVLHVLEELPLQEAAASLSVSLSTAKRRLKKANERIRRRVLTNPLLSEFIRERAGGLDLFDKFGSNQDTPSAAAQAEAIVGESTDQGQG